MIQYRATLIRPGTFDIEVHYFNIEGNPYTARTSISWMCERKHPVGMCIEFQNMVHVEKMEAFRKQREGESYVPEYADDPTYRHASLWDFYEAIGYNRKTKRWTDAEIKTTKGAE